ncbi:intracellular sulfur oxidation DsrE/DsrF family protein [Rhizobium herbae]|uniref:Intracellular sulfur oxidation DsrE/DsrF family protein n=1 Tax=Rhizobium herbae TaxID=508661 RepID=A0ABS4ERR7_9HYPH|nr:intracellular sulfur oxidation DsrE/DsrF family protein [Rhizobium herbae]
MTIKRRAMFAHALTASLGALFAARTATAATSPALEKQKVVYHLADTEKVMFVLGNIRNHIDGMGGPQAVDIVLVVHGPALTLFHKRKADPRMSAQVSHISGEGVHMAACGNTMAAQKVEIADLLPGFVRADEGGVVRIARLQTEGYVYIRP